MPEENQASPSSISPTLGKPKRNWKKILPFLLIGLFLISLFGIGIYLLILRLTQEPTSSTQKQASPPTQKQPAGKKGVLYIKATGEKNKPLPISLGNLVIYDLGDSKESLLTKDGKVGRFKVSPDRTKILFVRYLDERHSLWVFDLKTKKEEKISEISEVVSEKEYSTMSNLLWRADNKAVAYLVKNRSTDEDPRAIKKTTLYVVNLGDETTKIVGLPLGIGITGSLAWVGDELYYASSTEGGLQKLTSVNLVDKSTTDESSLINKGNSFGLPGASGSPNSRKFFVVAGDIKVVEIPSKKEILFSSSQKERAGLAWTFDGDGVILLLKEGDKLKITIKQLDKNQMKFALFPVSSKGSDLQVLGGFSDNDHLVGYTYNDRSYSYWLISLDDVTQEKISIPSDEFINLIPIEKF